VFLTDSETGAELLIMDDFYTFSHIQTVKDAKSVAAISNTDGVLLLTDSEIEHIGVNGLKISDIKLSGGFDRIFTDGKYIYLQGFNEINRLDLPK
jgi:hypothetical protein